MINFKFLGTNGSCQDLDSGNTSLLIGGREGSVCVDLSCNIAAVVDADVDAVVLTHEHIDHVYALPSLLHQLWLTGRARTLTIYVPKGMEYLPESLMDVFKIRSKKGIFDIGVSSQTRFCVGSLDIATLKTDHTDTSICTVIVEGNDKLVYTCDTRPIRSVPEIMRGAKLLIHEASGAEADEETLVKKGHSSSADAARFAVELGAERLFLCHLPRGAEQKERLLAEAKAVFPDTFLPKVLFDYHL